MTPESPLAAAVPAAAAGETADLLARWREDTPGCAAHVHLNNAGSSLPPRPVTAAIARYLEREAWLGGYETADEAAGEIAAAYDDVARLIGAGSEEIAVVENATVAWAQALSAFDFAPGDVIVTSRVDYPSNQLMYLSLARRQGVEVVRAADLPEGGIDPGSVAEILAARPRCRLVAVSWIPTNSGLIQDVEAVGEACERAGVPFLVDACQAVGQLPVDVARLRCDYLAATGRKFLRGPRGVGFLYVAERALARGDAPLMIDLRGASWTGPDDFELATGARRFENWEFSYALVLGLGAAARYAREVGEEGGLCARRLADYARERIATVPGCLVLEPGWREGRELAAIASVAVDGWDANELVAALRRQEIHTSASTRESGVLDMDAKRASTTLRVSPHYYNTREEIDQLVESLGEIVGR